MARRSDRGSVLLAAWVQWVPGTILIWASLALVLVLTAAKWWKTGNFDSIGLVGAVGVLTYALHPRIEFFDGGVQFPATNGQHAHFLTWQQVDRYRWDGDMLVIIGTNSVLSGGPSEGGTARIPGRQRGAADQILAAKVHSA
jgi:hypothetical protein